MTHQRPHRQRPHAANDGTPLSAWLPSEAELEAHNNAAWGIVSNCATHPHNVRRLPTPAQRTHTPPHATEHHTHSRETGLVTLVIAAAAAALAYTATTATTNTPPTTTEASTPSRSAIALRLDSGRAMSASHDTPATHTTPQP